MADEIVISSGSVSFDDVAGLESEQPVSPDEPVKGDVPMVPEKLEEDEKDETKEEKKPEPKKADSKKLKAKLGEDELDIDLETMVPVTIDGKEEMVPLSELRNGFSGSKAISKRFTDFDKEKKNFIKEKAEITGQIEKSKAFYTELEKKLDSENPYDALEYLVEKSGKSAYDFKYNKLLPAMMDEVVAMLQLDEAGRDAYLAKKENEYLKKGRESEQQNKQREQTIQELRARVDAMREASGVSEDEYVQAHNELAEMGHKDFKPENVIAYVENLRVIDKSVELIKSIDESKLANSEIVRTVAETMKNHPDISAEEIASELIAHWGLPLNDANKVGVKVEDKRSQPKKTIRGFESFDDFTT